MVWRGDHTGVPPCVVEATIGEASQLGENVENGFPNEIPDQLDMAQISFRNLRRSLCFSCG